MEGSNGTLSQNEGRAGFQEDLLLFFVPALVLTQKGNSMGSVHMPEFV